MFIRALVNIAGTIMLALLTFLAAGVVAVSCGMGPAG